MPKTTFTFRIEYEKLKSLKKEAKQNNTSVGAILRKLINERRLSDEK